MRRKGRVHVRPLREGNQQLRDFLSVPVLEGRPGAASLKIFKCVHFCETSESRRSRENRYQIECALSWFRVRDQTPILTSNL